MFDSLTAKDDRVQLQVLNRVTVWLCQAMTEGCYNINATNQVEPSGMTMEHVGSSTSESGVIDDEFYGSHLEVVNMGACFHFLLNQKMY